PAARSVKKRFMICDHSSGSSCSSSSIEPFTSAKRTVTCFRSPSSAHFDCRILSARCLGVYERRLAVRGLGVRVSLFPLTPNPWISAPHSSQNFAVRRSSEPQLAHRREIGAAQSSQNLATGRFSCPHAGQVMNQAPDRRARPEAVRPSLGRG